VKKGEKMNKARKQDPQKNQTTEFNYVFTDDGDLSVGIPSTFAKISVNVEFEYPLDIREEHPDNIKLFTNNLRKNLENITPFDTLSHIFTKKEYDAYRKAHREIEDHMFKDEIANKR
jgi:hypothetical protein